MQVICAVRSGRLGVFSVVLTLYSSTLQHEFEHCELQTLTPSFNLQNMQPVK